MADNVDPDPPPPPPEEAPPTQPGADQPVTPIPEDAPPPRQGCMDKRSGLEKVLLVLVIIILVVCLAFVAAFLIFYFFASPPLGTCLTDTCVSSASRLKSRMDDSVDPCNDFYQYACGGWFKENVLQQTESRSDFRTMITDNNNIKIKSLLMEPKKAEDPEYKLQTKSFYTACMKLDKIEDRGYEPYLEVIAEIGGFPALDPNWNETEFDLEDTLIELHKLKIQPLFRVEIRRDEKSGLGNNKFFLNDNVLSLKSKSVYQDGLTGAKVMQYEKIQVERLVLMDVERSVAEQDVKEAVEFEYKLAKIMRKDIDKAEVSTEETMRIAMLQSKYKSIKWLDFFRGISDPDDKIGVEEEVVNEEPSYLEKLDVLLSNTSTRVLANYLMSRTLELSSLLGEGFTKLDAQFQKDVLGNEPTERWETCVRQTTQVFPESVSRMYVDSYFSDESRESVNEVVEKLKESFTEQLKKSNWMGEKTKEMAEGKLKIMRSKIGYPDKLKEDERLNKLYTGIPSNENEYMETMIEQRRFSQKANMRTLNNVPGKDEWPVPAVENRGFYSYHDNSIVFPAAFLQDPVYSPDYTSSMNFASLGMLMTREITQGFDDVGSKYDSQGEPGDWWTPKDRENYDSRTECFVNQYGCYKWDGLSIDGEKTLGDNVADNGGLRQSYLAYRTYIRSRGTEEKRLPGLSLNHDQIFFLSFAQLWCAQYREEIKPEVVKSELPALYRVYGALQNSEEFSKAYNCPAGSRMNPMNKCVLW